MNRRLPADTKHAIVLGGSLAGLLASRVLTDHFERTSLIKRDGLPELAESEEKRGGGMSGISPHGVMESGSCNLHARIPASGDNLALPYLEEELTEKQKKPPRRQG